MPILTGALSDYISNRITIDSNDALKSSPTAKNADGTERTIEEYLSILKAPVPGSSWVKTEKARSNYAECVKKLRGAARLESERTLVNSMVKKLGW